MPSKVKIVQKKKTSGNHVAMYYKHQYDRVAKLEDLRLTITNVVIAISVASFTYTFTNTLSWDYGSGVILPLILIISNLFAIVYIYATLKVIRQHLNRARIVLKRFAPELSAISEKEPMPDWTEKFTLAYNQIIFHVLLIVLSSVPVWLYYRP